MKFELEGSASEGVAAGEVESPVLSEGMIASTTLGVKGVLASVVLLSHLWIREDFFGGRDVHELLLRHLLLLLVLELVRMPLKGQLLIRLGDPPFWSRSS